MRDRLAQLREETRALEPNAAERAALRDQVFAHAETYLARLSGLPGYTPPGDPGQTLLEAPLVEQPTSVEAVLALLQREVESSGVNLGSAGHLAFIPVSGLYTAALGDYLAAATGRYSGLFFAAPGAVRLERQLLRWMSGFVGYPATAAGDLTTGGSLANLIGVVTAREARALKAQDFARAVVYLTNQTHHSIAKALRIAGLKESLQRRIPLDDHYRMVPEELDEAIRADRQAGWLPWLVVATAGTTDTGAVDPLPAIAAIARQYGLWLHVDGAYGAMFALCPAGAEVLRGLDQSDSLVLDPHKGLFMPAGSGAVLVRDGQALLRAHYYHADYLQDERVLASPDEVSPADLSPELTRPFRGLRLWLSLKLLGLAPFRAALEEKLLLARYFHAQIRQAPGFEAGPPPDLSVVAFRYVPGRGDANAFNQRLIAALQRDGRVFMSSTLLNGTVMLRLAVLGPPTHLETIDLALELLQHKAKELESAG